MPKNLTMVLKDMPCLFIMVGIVVSLYHGYRGYVLQRWAIESQRHEAKQKAQKEGLCFRWFTTPTQECIIRCLYDAFFYCFCSAIGFLALWLAICMFNALPNIYDIPVGTGALLAFLILLAILGVGGILPHVIHLGKLPR